MSIEPFPLMIYREHLAGKSVEQISLDLGIPPERIAARLRAVRRWMMSRSQATGDALRTADSPLAVSTNPPPLVRANRCARCGAALDHNPLCPGCRAFFLTLTSYSCAVPRRVR